MRANAPFVLKSGWIAKPVPLINNFLAVFNRKINPGIFHQDSLPRADLRRGFMSGKVAQKAAG